MSEPRATSACSWVAGSWIARSWIAGAWVACALAVAAVVGCGRGETPDAEPTGRALDGSAALVARADALERDLTGLRDGAPFRRIERALDGLSSQGGEAVLLLERDVLRRASVTLYGEIGRVVLEYYLDARGQPVLVTRDTIEYEQPFGDVALETRERIYLENDGLAHWVVDGTARPGVSEAARVETRETILDVLERLNDLASQP